MLKQDNANIQTVIIIGLIAEGILAIPFFGWLFAASSGFVVLIGTFIVHVLALYLCTREHIPTHASIIGIIASILGAVPLLGWLLHGTAFLFYLVTLMGMRSDRFAEGAESSKQQASSVKDAEIEEE